MSEMSLILFASISPISLISVLFLTTDELFFVDRIFPLDVRNIG